MMVVARIVGVVAMIAVVKTRSNKSSGTLLAGQRLLVNRGSISIGKAPSLIVKCLGFGRQSVGKHLGAIIPPIGERAIAFTCIVPGRFKTTVDTTEHDGFGQHGRLTLGSRSLLL